MVEWVRFQYERNLFMELLSIASCFALCGNGCEYRAFGSGHINETYIVRTDTDCKYILQKINQYVFRNPQAVMENAIAITEFIRKKDADPRHALHFIQTKDGNYWYVDDHGDFWRMYDFMEGFCLDQGGSLEDLYQGALAFGRFQMMLSDFPAATLHETIPNFHHTPNRFHQFRLSVEEDKAGRVGGVRDVIARLLQHEQLACTPQQMLDAGQLPLRVTHNDTKLNNVLLDNATRQYLCVLDLDTVMPGLSLYDFGDAVRFGAATGAEDTQDLDHMGIDLEAYRVYTRGFLETATTLTGKEIELLHIGPIAVTLELVTRFLKDYLDGDLYFKTAYPEHNLVRSLAQLKLAEDMISKMDIMQQIVCEELAKIRT